MHGVGLHGGGHIGGSDGYGGHGAEEGTASITPPDVSMHGRGRGGGARVKVY